MSCKRMRPAWALLGLLAAGCAAHRVEELQESSEPQSSESRSSETSTLSRQSQGMTQAAKEASLPSKAEGFALRYSEPVVCEYEARQLLEQSRDEGWAALKSCVAGTHFTLLRTLLEPAWLQELRARPDAARLLARVIALRGGSVEGDLRLLHEKRLPVFGLSAVMAQPEATKGRYVLLRARIKKFDHEGQLTTVRLAEQKLESVGTDKQVGTAEHIDQESSYRGRVAGSAGMLGRVDARGELSSRESKTRRTTVRHFDNVPTDTGREALGRLPKPDAFLSPEQEYVMLARFDGLRTTSGGEAGEEEPPSVPVLTLISYEVPHPLVVY